MSDLDPLGAPADEFCLQWWKDQAKHWTVKQLFRQALEEMRKRPFVERKRALEEFDKHAESRNAIVEDAISETDKELGLVKAKRAVAEIEKADRLAAKIGTTAESVLMVWYVAGSNALTLSPELQQALEATDIPPSRPPMPFHAIAITATLPHLGKTTMLIYQTSDSGQMRLYVPWNREAEGFDPMQKKIFKLSAIDKPPIDDPVKWNRMIAAARVSFAALGKLPSTYNDTDFASISIMEKAKHVAIAALWWWTSAAPKGQLVKERAKKKGKDRARRLPTRWLLQRPVKLRKGTREAIRNAADHQSKTGSRLLWQHVVRGHFKQQVHGKGRKMRKTIWVAPYWRGPDVELGAQHEYKA